MLEVVGEEGRRGKEEGEEKRKERSALGNLCCVDKCIVSL